MEYVGAIWRMSMKISDMQNIVTEIENDCHSATFKRVNSQNLTSSSRNNNP